MAQGSTSMPSDQTQSGSIPPPDVDPIEILRQGLMTDQIAATNEAAVRMTESSKQMVVNQGISDIFGIQDANSPAAMKLTSAEQSVVDERLRAPYAAYGIQDKINQMRSGANIKRSDVIAANGFIDALADPETGAKYVATFPPGSKISTKTKNIVTRELPDGSVEIFARQPVANVPPAKVFQATQEAYSRPQGALFNLENEMSKVKTLTGEERLDGITVLISNIDAQMTSVRQRIGQQAAIQSGYTAAQTALDRALAIDQLPNPNFGGMSFFQRFGVASAEVVQAQEMLRTTQVSMAQLEESMLRKDSEFNRYASAREAMKGRETLTAQRQARADERREDRDYNEQEKKAAKEEQVRSMIPQQQTAAMQILSPDSNATEANAQLMKLGPKSPEWIASASTPETIYANLTHPDLKVRQLALKVLNSYDKANNPNYASMEETPIVNRIKKFVANPALLEQEAKRAGIITQDDLNTLSTSMAAGDAKDKASKRAGFQASVLQKYFEKYVKSTYTTNMAKWQATETGPNTSLGMVIASVAKSNPNGAADMGTVIEKYINDPTNTLPYEQRVQTLNAALVGAVGNDFKTMLFPNTSDVQNDLQSQITNAAARARIKMRSPEIKQMQLSPEFGFQTFGSGRP